MREHALVAGLRAALANATGEVFVVAPSGRASRVLAAAALAPGKALLGVAFTTWNGLAKSLLRRLGRPAPAEVDGIVERARLELAIAALGKGPLAEVLALPASMPTLMQAWHEAGRADPRALATAQLHDDARALLALPAPASAVRTLVAELEHGTKAARGCLREIAVLIVGSLPPDGLHTCVREALVNAGVQVEQVPYASTIAAHRELWCAPDFASEARLAARLCGEAHARGIPFGRMVVVAPKLGVYVPWLHSAFAAERVPFVAQATTPLAQEPRGALLVHVARVCLGDAPRESFVALRMSPLANHATAVADMARLELDARSRDAHGRGPATAALAAGLPLGGPELSPTTRLREFLASYAKPPAPHSRDARAAEAIEEVLTVLDSLLAIRPESTGAAFVTALEELVATRGSVLASDRAEPTTHAVHIVEPDQALAFPAAHLHLMGLSASLVPGSAPDETWLRDDDRKELGLLHRDILRQREATLLGACLQHATTSCVLSRPARDLAGRASEASLWHSGLWSAATGESGGNLAGNDLAGSDTERREQVVDLAEFENVVPMHPAARAEQRIAAGECPADLALTALALERSEPALLAGLLPRGRGAIAAHARALESFAPTTLARDAILGPGAAPDPARSISVSALQNLAACPQRYWFQHELRLAALPEPQEPMALPRDRLGTAVHEALCATQEHFAARLRGTADPLTLADEVVGFAKARLAKTLAEQCGEALRTLPELLLVLGEAWQRAIEHSLRAELAFMKETGARPLHSEHLVQAVLQVRRGAGDADRTLALRGRIDRLDTMDLHTMGKDQLGIVDYKTGNNANQAASKPAILRGTHVQLVAYGMMLEAQQGGGKSVSSLASVAVNPDVEPDENPRKEIKGALDYLHGELAEQVHDTLATLQELRVSGSYPMNRNSVHCSFCDWSLACRRLHPPSVSRVEASGVAELARYLLLAEKKFPRSTGTQSADDAP